MRKFTRWFTAVLIAAVAFSCSSIELPEEMEQVNEESELVVQRSDIFYGLRKIQGTVTDQSGEPVIGASVTIVGGTQGVITDLDGKFMFYAEFGDILRVSYIGYRSIDVPILSQSVFNIKLSEDSQTGGGSIDQDALPIVEFSGKVVDLNGNPLSDVTVVAGLGSLGSTTVYTDKDGKYSTKGKLTYYITFRKDGYDYQTWRIAENLASIIYMVPEDLPINVSGTVTDFYGLPAGGVKVQVENGSAYTYTSSGGTYGITAPKNGTLLFSKTGYINTTRNIIGSTTLDAVINNETVTVTGDVKSNGAPLADVTVTAQGTTISTTTGTSGYYSIQVPFNSRLEFTKTGYNTVTRYSLEPVMDVDMIPTPPTTRRISGTIVDEYGEPVIGATVLQKGTTNGVISDLDGWYTLNIPINPKVILRFEFIGMIPQEITVGDKTVLNVTLKEDPYME